MNEPQQPGESGWTAAKVLGVVVGLLLLVGFGVCGLCGIVLNLDAGRGEPMIWGLSVVGLAIAAGGFFLIRRMVRLARQDRERQ